MRSFKNKRGLTLVELTITIALASIMVYGITSSMHQQIRSSVQTRDYLVAMNIARLKMSEVRSEAYPATGTTTLTAEASFPGYMIQRVVTNVVSNGARSVRQVEINVARTGGSFSSPLVRLVTQLTSVATFGDGI